MNQLDISKISIAYISTDDPNDKRSWSGTHYHMLQSLKLHFPGTQALGPIELPLYQKVIEKFYDWVLNKILPGYNDGYTWLKMIFSAVYFEKLLKKQKYDLIFCSVCSTVLARLKTNAPVVYLSDATFSALENYYTEYTGLPKLCAYEGNLAEQNSINRADLVLYSSDWAKRHAISDYDAEPGKIEVYPYGANILEDPGDAPTMNKLKGQQESDGQAKTCQLLFLAREWERKGGEVVLETTRELVCKGYSIELIVVGCGSTKLADEDHVTVHSFLDKNLKNDYDEFVRIITTSHFLFLPTLADCTPMVFAEANAYGMPAITRDTGGVSTIVKNNVNGYILPDTASASDYASLIEDKYFNSNEYSDLVTQSREYYKNNLSWDIWALNTKNAILKILFCND